MILSAHNKEIDSTEQSYSAAPVPPSSVPQHMMEEKNGTTKLQNHPMITDTQNQHDSSSTHHNGHHSAQCCSKGSSEHSSSSLESIPPASFMVQHSHTFHAQPLSTHAAAPVSNCNDDGSSSCSNFQSSEPSEGVSLDNHNRCINHGMSSDIYSRPTREDVLKRLSEALLRRSLTMIDLSQRGLQPSDARLVKLALLQNSSLSVLKLGYNNLSDEGVVTLASGISNHTALTSLDLGFNNVGNEGCRALALAIVSAMKNGGKMHTLYLAGNRITQQGAHALAEVFLESKRYCGAHGLKRIHLTGNKVGPDGIRCLMEAIVVAEGNGNADMASNDDELSNHKMNDCDMLEQGIEELFLGGTGMGYMGCAAVAKMLETSRSLQVLSLSNCELDDNSALLIASSIAKNCQHLPLKRLELSFNNLTSKGVEALMNAVWGLKCLEDLQLDNNRMEGRGAQVVSAVLGGVKTLKKLDVGFNRITENGMKLLMKAVAENSSLCSLTISGNNIDTMGSAKAVAYALAHNKSLKSIFLDHCTIPRDGQRHITAGIVSNSGTSLEVLTGFPVGANAVTLGLPPELETWTNEQVLNFISFMWNEKHSSDVTNGIIPCNGPLDPTTVVTVAKLAFESLTTSGEAMNMRAHAAHRSVSFDSPLTEDAIIMESNENGSRIDNDYEETYGNKYGKSLNDPTHCSSVNGDLQPKKNKTHVPSPSVNAATKKKMMLEWLCKNIQHLNELSQLPFNSSELWRLHQHFFSPTTQLAVLQNDSDHHSMSQSKDGSNSYDSGSGQCTSVLSAPCAACPMANSAPIPSSEPAIHGNKSLLKRKVSYRFLGEATLSSSTPETSTIDQSVSRLIEDMNGQTMQHRSKRPRRNRSRISIVPRIKQKLDSFLDSDHQKALGLMRQLYYVEKSLLSGNVYPIDDIKGVTHLIGALASDAETILIDMM